MQNNEDKDMKKQLPTEYNGKKLEKMNFRNHFDEMEYAESMCDDYYELKDEYQELVNIYQEIGKHLKIEDYMFDDKKKNRPKTEQWKKEDDLPF